MTKKCDSSVCFSGSTRGRSSKNKTECFFCHKVLHLKCAGISLHQYNTIRDCPGAVWLCQSCRSATGTNSSTVNNNALELILLRTTSAVRMIACVMDTLKIMCRAEAHRYRTAYPSNPSSFCELLNRHDFEAQGFDEKFLEKTDEIQVNFTELFESILGNKRYRTSSISHPSKAKPTTLANTEIPSQNLSNNLRSAELHTSAFSSTTNEISASPLAADPTNTACINKDNFSTVKSTTSEGINNLAVTSEIASNSYCAPAANRAFGAATGSLFEDHVAASATFPATVFASSSSAIVNADIAATGEAGSSISVHHTSASACKTSTLPPTATPEASRSVYNSHPVAANRVRTPVLAQSVASATFHGAFITDAVAAGGNYTSTLLPTATPATASGLFNTSSVASRGVGASSSIQSVTPAALHDSSSTVVAAAGGNCTHPPIVMPAANNVNVNTDYECRDAIYSIENTNQRTLPTLSVATPANALKQFYLSPFAPDESTDNIIKYITYKTKCSASSVFCTKLVKRDRPNNIQLSFVSFKVCVKDEIASVITERNFWPEGITIAPFLDRAPQRTGTRRSTSNTILSPRPLLKNTPSPHLQGYQRNNHRITNPLQHSSTQTRPSTQLRARTTLV